MLNSGTTLTIVGTLFIVLALLASILLKIKGKPNKKQKPKYRYSAKKHIMTNAEENFFKTLSNIFEHRFYIIPQVHLSTLLEHKIKGQDWRAAFFHINGKSVDFILCDKVKLTPICAIELDDRSHDSASRIERDVEVERIFGYAKFPFVRFRNINSLTNKEIVDKVAKALKGE